ncbi:MAG TPA: HEAT repeat domain-containing protein [Sandaracinaceae bacterium LLY-WYZ-13_1]|nr:HEAT repeat domain-containing protein [Sandaracinaceae bacterium LLY-WYZ-13_1]
MDPNTELQDDDHTELPGGDLPDPPADDAFAAADLGAPATDDDALKKMGSRTPAWGWIALIVLVLGVAGVGVVWWQQNQAYQNRWEAYNAAQSEAENEEDFLRRMRELLPETQYEDVKIRILQKVAEYEDAAAVPVVVEQLDSQIPTVRVAAARALAAIGSPDADAAKPDLLRVLERSGEGDRAAVVWALAVLGESAAADAIIEEFSGGRLQGQPGFDPAVISDVLGPERLSSNELLNHEETSVRVLTASALAEAATPDVIDPLSRMVDFELGREEPDENVLRAIASGLGRAGDARAGGPLFRILENQPRMRSVVLDSLRKTVGAPGIAALLESAEDVSIERELVRMLANSHDPRAADDLAGYVDHEDGDIRQDAAFGLAELGDPRAVPALLDIATGDDTPLAREALSHLQRLGAEQAADPLAEMLDEERFLARRANVLRALGTTGASHVGSVIEDQLETDDVSSAALALADLDYDPTYDQLHDMIPRPSDVDFSTPTVANEEAFMNRTAAVRAIGRYGRPEAAETLMEVVEDPMDDQRLRHDAALALGAVATDEHLRTVLEKLQDPELDEVAKRFYVSALWQNPSREIAPDLMDLIADANTPPDVKRAAALAVGYAADPALDERVASMLADEGTQREAAFMIVLGGSPANGRALLDALDSNAELQQVILFTIRDDGSNAFNLVTQDAFETGQIWRRLEVARILNEGEGDNRHGYVWNHLIQRLQAGWDGHDGMTPRAIREELWNALRGDDAARRDLAADVLAAMDERGLLMSARDQGGPGSEEARDQLRAMNNPEARD